MSVLAIKILTLRKTNSMQASLFLIPVTLGDTDHRRVLPEYNREIILQIKHFIVENIRTARRFLKKTEPSIVIDDLTFYELNKHTSPEDVAGYLVPLTKGEHVGVISEAGCPAVADPGADVVAIAQRKNYPVVPLVGPSSILMSVTGRVLPFMVICPSMLRNGQIQSKSWKAVSIRKTRHSFLLKHLTVTINWLRS